MLAVILHPFRYRLFSPGPSQRGPFTATEFVSFLSGGWARNSPGLRWARNRKSMNPGGGGGRRGGARRLREEVASRQTRNPPWTAHTCIRCLPLVPGPWPHAPGPKLPASRGALVPGPRPLAPSPRPPGPNSRPRAPGPLPRAPGPRPPPPAPAFGPRPSAPSPRALVSERSTGSFETLPAVWPLLRESNSFMCLFP